MSAVAGFIEYNSLPGVIKTGCQLSPCATSKFCYYHAPRVSCPTETGTATEDFTKIITAVHETRNGKHYQVYLHDAVCACVDNAYMYL